MSKYAYPAVFTIEPEGGYSVNFPDLKGCYTCGDDLAETLEMAEDALALTLYRLEKAGKSIPGPSDVNSLELKPGQFSSYVHCDTLEYHKRNNNRAIKKTLSIPEWMNEEATAAGLNFSQVLQEALKERLQIK